MFAGSVCGFCVISLVWVIMSFSSFCVFALPQFLWEHAASLQVFELNTARVGGLQMRKRECVANVIECQQMAFSTRDANERRVWLETAIGWARLAEIEEAPKVA